MVQGGHRPHHEKGEGLNPAALTIGVFRDSGYRTGMFGKWHLGDQPPFRPDRQGFSSTFYNKSNNQTKELWRETSSLRSPLVNG